MLYMLAQNVRLFWFTQINVTQISVIVYIFSFQALLGEHMGESKILLFGFGVSHYNLVGCEHNVSIFLFWTNRFFHTGLQTQHSSGRFYSTSEIRLNSWVWNLIWSLPLLFSCVQSFVCSVSTCVCMLIWFMRFWSNPSFLSSNGIVSFTYSNLFPDTLGISKADLPFFYTSHTDCCWKIRPCLFLFFFSVSCVSAGWSRRKSQTTMQSFPVTMAVWFAGWELKHTHTHIPSRPAS